MYGTGTSTGTNTSTSVENGDAYLLPMSKIVVVETSSGTKPGAIGSEQ